MGRKKEGALFGKVVSAIKEQKLKKHLEKEVPKLVRAWLKELQPQRPFYPGGWSESPYRPSIERDEDSNHILRRHLKSRRLWEHYTSWEQYVDKAHALAVEVRTISKQIYEGHQKTLQSPRQLTDDYLEIALWRGFDFALNENPQNWYGPGDNSKGVKYGTWVIETSASPEEVELVAKEHWNLICQLGRLPKMGLLVKEWQRVQESGKRIQALAEKALAEHDIFNPCRFCRRLWD